MEALEKSKNRIELLDELSTKLSEAISTKENQLISNVAIDTGVEKEQPAASVWSIKKPKEDVLQESNERGESNSANVMPEDGEYELESNYKTVTGVSDEKISVDRLRDIIDQNDTSLEIVSSYEIFFDHIDGQLIGLESEIVRFLRLTTAVLEEEKLKDLNVQTLFQLLKAVRNTRERLANDLEVGREGVCEP